MRMRVAIGVAIAVVIAGTGVVYRKYRDAITSRFNGE